jgi:3-deoxy-D-manno-octulosonic-acid transferase
MKVLYNLGILVYALLANIFAPFNKKAKQWVAGRKNWKEQVTSKINPGDRTCWFHCSSLGEFEQGRPIIEEIRKRNPDIKIVITFFSPSGYEIRKNYQGGDCILYLPSDTPSNARQFIELIRPEFAIFIKYEFWNNYITDLSNRNIPLYIVSAIFRPDQHFFKWYGGFFRNILRRFRVIFVQDEQSVKLLSNIGITNVVIAGDTRYDRVVQIAAAAKDIPKLESFRGDEKMFLVGSSWDKDEEIICRYINNNPGRMKWVFAPHEIDESNIKRLESLLTTSHVRFSQYSEGSGEARVMIIDNIGMLSSAYRYAYIAAIGGGFGKGIHNVLEAACWGIPVMFGPRHQKFREAVDLIKENGAVSFDSYEKFSDTINKWLTDESFYLKSAKSASLNVSKNTGATAMILGEIFQKDMNKRS